MIKFFLHLWLVTKHRFRVFLYCTYAGFFWRGLVHDLSKYSFREFFPSVKYYQGNRSPVFKQREMNNYYSEIGIHHTRKNKHHWEYWVDIYKGGLVLRTLPYAICLEMVCDMIAASKTYNPKNDRNVVY
ncbi:MAG: DUF5662 family protein, partial [Bacillales bacterium]|nr:DUF5662 family protein [Bacillales bacterium]